MSDLHCDMALLVQADFDGELSAADAARVELHRGQCAICRQTYDELARVRAAFAAEPFRQVASSAFRARLQAQTVGTSASATRYCGPHRRDGDAASAGGDG